MAVVLRVVDACGIDKQIRLVDHGKGVSITVTTSKGSSVRSQLLELARRHPDRSAEALCELVEVTSHHLTSPEDRAQGVALLGRLEDPDFFPVPQTDLFVHGRVYSLWIQRVPNKSYHEFYGPGRGHTEEPLEHWAFDALEAFGLLCASGSPG